MVRTEECPRSISVQPRHGARKRGADNGANNDVANEVHARDDACAPNAAGETKRRARAVPPLEADPKRRARVIVAVSHWRYGGLRV